MSWEERPLEKHVYWLLSTRLQSEGENLWNIYQNTRNELITDVLPWIAKCEPDLTDHGPTHIRDVIDNAGLLLGFKNHFGENIETFPYTDYSPHEMFILLAGLLLHDVGNVLGRKSHNQKILSVWNSLKCWNLWGSQDRQLVYKVGRAHSGKENEDTLKPLSISPEYFYKHPVNLAKIAAIVRFADELAEGPQRTSQFLLGKGLISENSELYHHYAQITQVSIDAERIALTYHIETNNINYPKNKNQLKKFLKELLKMVYARAAKMNLERQLARHYATILAPFKETSISITFLKEGCPIDLSLEPIALNDFNSSLVDSHKKIETLYSHYKIDVLVNQILESK